jgi:glyoxylase-like metal-dependent hydrolase (beta-lactamase superfamily II)
MTAHVLLTRRMLLRDMGRAGLAVMVLGTTACATNPTSNATPTEEPATTPSSTAASVTPSTGETTGTTSAGSTTTEGGHQWHRADLGFVSAYILYRGGEAALVDTGVGGSETTIQAALAEVGLGWDSVAHVIVTHKHPDHQGSVEAVIAATGAPWYAGAADLGEIAAGTEGEAVGDGDHVFGLQVIETPGHTPGHISVLDPVSGVLVTGDALTGSDGGVAGPNPGFSEDIDLANASVGKLAGFGYETALFGHGEPVLTGASAMVAGLTGSGG